MKLRVLVITASIIVSAIIYTESILSSPAKQSHCHASNVIDVAEEGDLETVNATKDLSEQPFDFYADDFTVEEQRED